MAKSSETMNTNKSFLRQVVLVRHFVYSDTKVINTNSIQFISCEISQIDSGYAFLVEYHSTNIQLKLSLNLFHG